MLAEASALWAGSMIRNEDYFSRGPDEKTWRPLESGKFYAANAPPGRNADVRRIGLERAGAPGWVSSYLQDGGLGRTECFRTHRGLGLEIEELGLGLWAMDLETATVFRLSAGWPMACLRAVRWETTNPWHMPPAATWKGAVAAPVMLRGPRRYPVEGVLLIAPAWPGLAIDSLVFGAILWGALFGRVALVQAFRRRRGQCVVCGYDLAGLRPDTHCPECGG
jgi:hypothetical protein